MCVDDQFPKINLLVSHSCPKMETKLPGKAWWLQKEVWLVLHPWKEATEAPFVGGLEMAETSFSSLERRILVGWR